MVRSRASRSRCWFTSRSTRAEESPRARPSRPVEPQEWVRGCSTRSRKGALLLLTLGALVAGACVYDADDRCSPGQVLLTDSSCGCAPGSAFTPQGCVPCAENEVAGPNGCICAEGLSRPTPDAACQAPPQELGVACDTQSAPCTSPTYDHCQIVSGSSGYCTTSGCSSSAECQGGYACDTAASPPFCRRPPLGAGNPCESPADCAGTEATWCDTFMTHTCLVQGCSVSAQDCFVGEECCDLSRFGLPAPLCLPQGACP
jgi:hypothetical protein